MRRTSASPTLRVLTAELAVHADRPLAHNHADSGLCNTGTRSLHNH
jgi:hypothetical protein